MSNWIDQLTKAYQSMEEKKKLDPVGQADADIDNDGDVDSSDEYLHKRRKAIKKASKEEQASCDSGKKRVKEEMDPTDHVKQKDGGKYCVYDKDGEVVAEFDSEAEANAYAKKNHDKLMGESVEEVQELNKSTLKNYRDKARKSRDELGKKSQSSVPVDYGYDKENRKKMGAKSQKRANMIMKATSKIKAKEGYGPDDKKPTGGKEEVIMNPKKKKDNDKNAEVQTQESTKWPIYQRIQEKNVVDAKAVPPEEMTPASTKGDHISDAAAAWIKAHAGNQKPEDYVDAEKILKQNDKDLMRTVPGKAKEPK